MTADRPATEPRTAQYFDPLAVMVGEFARDFVEPTARMDAIDRLYSMLNEARAEAAQGAAPPPHHPNVPGKQHVLPKPTQPRPKPAPPPPGAAPRAEGLDTVTIPRAEYEALMRYDEGRAAEYARLSRPSDERVPEEER